MATALLEANRDAVFHLLLLEPLSAAVCSPLEIREMFEELALAERDHSPEFMRTG
jgi:alpha-galactosidase